MPLVEHATMTLAEQAGIRVARTLPVRGKRTANPILKAALL